MLNNKNNLYKIETQSRSNKEKFLKQKSKVIWMTGLSGSGKSTIALALEKYFLDNGVLSTVLDGDNLRLTVNNGLGFTIDDRIENIRRTSEIAKIFIDNGIVVIVSLITPTNELRNLARNIIGDDDFIEVYVNSPLDICIERDPKGLYKKQIENFTGVSSIFEEPIQSNIILNTNEFTVDEEVKIIYNYYKKNL